MFVRPLFFRNCRLATFSACLLVSFSIRCWINWRNAWYKLSLCNLSATSSLALPMSRILTAWCSGSFSSYSASYLIQVRKLVFHFSQPATREGVLSEHSVICLERPVYSDKMAPGWIGPRQCHGFLFNFCQTYGHTQYKTELRISNLQKLSSSKPRITCRGSYAIIYFHVLRKEAGHSNAMLCGLLALRYYPDSHWYRSLCLSLYSIHQWSWRKVREYEKVTALEPAISSELSTPHCSHWAEFTPYQRKAWVGGVERACW